MDPIRDWLSGCSTNRGRRVRHNGLQVLVFDGHEPYAVHPQPSMSQAGLPLFILKKKKIKKKKKSWYGDPSTVVAYRYLVVLEPQLCSLIARQHWSFYLTH